MPDNTGKTEDREPDGGGEEDVGRQTQEMVVWINKMATTSVKRKKHKANKGSGV